ncbi:P-loop containing nucleoside triphosphate hydrolase protein [Ochromonadaceae sp. CCMP2298]|nr:P-loop containing nucleoside triphosphate hydrolase protein [Ochromonadaceae sp. CCMP2298]
MSHHSYPPESSQGDIYSSVCDLAASTIRGYNTTIFAYGAAGTGKTYTMAGTEKKKGVIPRITEDIFVAIQACEGSFHVEVSYVELHNNTFLNLLQAQSDKLTAQGGEDLETRKGMEESPLLGVYLAGVPNLRLPVSTAAQVSALLKAGNEKLAHARAAHAHTLHTILTLYVESRVTIPEGTELRLGKMHFVDLAGFERVTSSVDRGGSGGNGGNGGNGAAGPAPLTPHTPHTHTHTHSHPHVHVPYHDSKLTHLLADALGGNCKTVMLVTVGSEEEGYMHTMQVSLILKPSL